MVSGILGYVLSIDQYLGPLIKNFGIFIYALLFIVLFMETGLVVAPFLPGDSLLFIAGTFAAHGELSIFFLLVIFCFAAILGDTINYWIGEYFGKRVLVKYIKKDYLDRTNEFYARYGPKAIVIGRFIPFIRTFVPFVAGIGKMKYSKFLAYNVIGGIIWVVIFLFAGYFFGTIPLVKDNLTISVIVIIIISFIPAIVEYLRYKHKKEQAVK